MRVEKGMSGSTVKLFMIIDPEDEAEIPYAIFFS